MIKTETELTPIKETKSVGMVGDEQELLLTIKDGVFETSVFIPIKSIFQVQRGITSYIQKHYRKQFKKV